MTTTHQGWTINAYRKVPWPKTLDFMAMAERKEGNKRIMFNVEGNSLIQAVEKAKRRIEQME